MTTPVRILFTRYRALLLVRHGNTMTAARDFDRSLSEEGGRQCARAATTWLPKVERQYRFTTIVHSTARRCGQTLRSILKDRSISPIPEPTLYDDILQPKAKGLWQACGYAPLSDYFAQPGGEAFLMNYANTVLWRLSEVCHGEQEAGAPAQNSDQRDSALLVCGHSIYLNAIALQVAKELQLSESEKDLSLQTRLAETDGFLVVGHPKARMVLLEDDSWDVT